MLPVSMRSGLRKVIDDSLPGNRHTELNVSAFRKRRGANSREEPTPLVAEAK
jgi:hypothetical protein